MAYSILCVKTLGQSMSFISSCDIDPSSGCATPWLLKFRGHLYHLPKKAIKVKASKSDPSGLPLSQILCFLFCVRL